MKTALGAIAFAHKSLFLNLQLLAQMIRYGLCFFALIGCFAPIGLRAQVTDTTGIEKRLDSLRQIGLALFSRGEFEEGLPIARNAMETARICLGENHLKYATAANLTGAFYFYTGNYIDAEKMYLKSLDIRLRILGEEHPDYAKVLENLGSLYFATNEYSKAENIYLKTLEVKAKTVGIVHQDYAQTLYNLGVLYYNQNNFIKAESYYLEAKRIQKNTLEIGNPQYFKTLYNLALLYQVQGNYTKAEPFLLEAKAIGSIAFGINHPEYASILHNLATNYKKKRDFEIAEQLYLKAIDIWGENKRYEVEYSLALINLANIYHLKEDYGKAEPLYLKAKVIRGQVFGKNSKEYASSLHSLATIYEEKGDYAKAEPLYLEAILIREKIYGKENEVYASSVNNLAVLYNDKGDYSKAEPLFLETKAIREKVLGKEHQDYALSVNNLAVLYLNKGDYIKAESLFLYATEILLKVLGKENPDYATSLNNLASLYGAVGDFKKAEQLYFESKEIRLKVLGKETLDYSSSINDLALICQKIRKTDLAASYFMESINVHHSLIKKTAIYCSENEMLAYLQKFKKNFEEFYSFAQTHSTPLLSCTAFNNALFINGFLLENVRSLANAAVATDSLTNDSYERWQGCRRRLANEYAKPIAERQYVAEVEADAEGFEKILTRNLSAFKEANKVTKWQDVLEHLRPDEAAIEFIHYHYYTPDPTDSIIYAALLLLPNDTTPHFIPLCEQRQLEALVFRQNGAKANYLQNLYASQQTDGNASLYQLLWAPLQPLLKEHGIKTVYYASSGLLHRLNLAAIAEPNKSGTVLADSFHLVAMGSTRDLVNHHAGFSSPNSAMIYGGVRFEMDSTAIANANIAQNVSAQDTTGGLFGYANRPVERGGALEYLPGTEREALFLQGLLQKQQIPVILRLGYSATEESFKQIGRPLSPSLLHIGTHGFFFPDPKDTTHRRTIIGEDAPAFKISEHPLIRSGLMLAGSRYAWENKHPMHGMEDGILTAYEVSQMNLSNTDLVVLSACETGLGDIRGNEGVYGLQRAFRIAGAKNVLMSLWKVNDEVTEKLLTRFYQNWLEGKMPVREAFEAAQKWMREFRNKEGLEIYRNPYFWAGFVLIGQ